MEIQALTILNQDIKCVYIYILTKGGRYLKLIGNVERYVRSAIGWDAETKRCCGQQFSSFIKG